MGAEAICTARFNGRTTKGKARLEMDTLEFRGPDVRLSIPFKQITKVNARDGALTVDSGRGPISLRLGDAAEKWAAKIQHPRSRFDKLGVKKEWRVSALGVSDDAFLAELAGAVAELSIGRTLKDSDAIFFSATREAELTRLAKLKDSLKSNGALWIIRPKAPAAMPARERASATRARHQRAGVEPREKIKKSPAEVSERAVMAAGKAAGLVDVKVVSFSPTHTAEKFVIPVKDRR